MGVVYSAEQEEPLKRRVALKLIKSGRGAGDVLSRFELERQALAVMSHPSIAKVFDAGVAPDGRPYFAMELVEGVRIDRYADERGLTTRERLALIPRVCDAISHAHQKGVVHRDLKPSNVLVAEEDGSHHPRIIDFGIAKAATGSGLRREDATQFGHALGTLAYMSPEQATSAVDVDTRSDVYSIGVLLYELLAGVVPVDPGDVGAAAFFVSLLQPDHTPPTMSRRLGSLDAERASAVAEARQTDIDDLRGRLAGDPQWIVGKALQKDRELRYQTAGELAADIRRLLADRPVHAHPPSQVYRLRKFVRRNRTGAILATGLAVSLVAFAASMSIQSRRLAVERDRVAVEARTAQRVSDFLTQLFTAPDPSQAQGREVTALEMLERGTERIHGELADEPTVQGRLLNVMGDVYMGLGLFEDSERLLLEGLEAHRRGPERPDSALAKSLHNLAWLYVNQQRLDEAMLLAQQARDIYAETVGTEHRLYARVLQIIGMVERDTGNFSAGRNALTTALQIQARILPPNDVDIGWSHLPRLACL